MTKKLKKFNTFLSENVDRWRKVSVCFHIFFSHIPTLLLSFLLWVTVSIEQIFTLEPFIDFLISPEIPSCMLIVDKEGRKKSAGKCFHNNKKVEKGWKDEEFYPARFRVFCRRSRQEKIVYPNRKMFAIIKTKNLKSFSKLSCLYKFSCFLVCCPCSPAHRPFCLTEKWAKALVNYWITWMWLTHFETHRKHFFHPHKSQTWLFNFFTHPLGLNKKKWKTFQAEMLRWISIQIYLNLTSEIFRIFHY